jgi:malonyl CoA-acyl carrier protein transacylase
MKTLLDEITESGVEPAYYVIAGQFVITGQPEEVPRSAMP